MKVDHASASPADVRTVFVGVLIGLSLAAISQTFVTTALPTMVGDLGGFDALSWVVSAYLLTSAVVVPFAGKLADLFGTARMFQAAIVVFAIGSLLAAVSTTMVALIIARGVQGVGGGAIMTLAFTVVAHIVPARERGRYQGYIASLFAVTSVTGPLIGGFFVDHLTWRLAFVFNVVLAAFALLIVRRRLPADEVGPRRPLDVVGAALLVVALVSTMLVAVWGGQQHAWTSPIVVGLALVGVTGFVAFLAVERHVEEPIVPLGLFSRRVVRTSTAIGFLTGVTMFGVIVYAPTFLQVSLGVTATRSGFLLVPLMGCVLVGSTLGGRVMSRTARFKRVVVAGSVLLAVGTGLLVTVDPDTPGLVLSAYVGIVGLGLGLTMPSTVVAVQNAVGKAQLGAATSISQFSRKIGATLGVAALGGLFNARVASELEGELPVGTTPADLLEAPAAIRRLPPAVARAVEDAVAGGTTTVFAVAFAAAVVAAVVSLRLPDDRLADADDLDDAGGDRVIAG